jgi:hypothetical protein
MLAKFSGNETNLCRVAEEVRDNRSFESRENTPGDAEDTESNSISDEGNEAEKKNGKFADFAYKGTREGNIRVAEIFQRLREKLDLKKKREKGEEKDREHIPNQTPTSSDNLVPDSATSVDSAALASLATSTPTVNDSEQVGTLDSATSFDSAAHALLATLTTTVNNPSIDVDSLNGAASLPVQTLVANDMDNQAESIAMDVDEENGNDPDHQLKAKIDTMDVEEENCTSKSSISTEIDGSKAPAWLTARLDYLRGISEEKAWQDLIASFLKFEMENTTTGVRTYLHFH